MAIVPSRDNFDVGVQQFGARLSGAPAPADVTRNTRVLAQGLMAAGRIADEHERIDAAAEANAFAQFLDNQQAALAERKGINAWRNEDGTLVRDTIDQNINDELSRMRSSMSASKREKFDAMILPFQRNFNRNATNYISQQYNAYEKATLDDTKAQYGKMAFANSSSDPESALQALNDFHGVARYQAMKDGADEKLADSLANRQTSGIVRGIIDDALENGDLKTAQAYQQRFSKIMSADDLIHVNRNVRRQESISIGEDYAAKAFAVGAQNYAMRDMNAVYNITMQSESGGKRYDKSGNLTESPKGALGEYQVMPETAKNPGFGIQPAKDDSPEELARVGREYLDVMIKRYDGDLAKMWGAYNAGPGTVDDLVKQYGNDWLSHAPKETQDYVQKNVAAWSKRNRDAVKLMSVAEFSTQAKEVFGNDRQAYQAAVDDYSRRSRAFEASDRQEQEERLNAIYNMVDEGKTMTEIEQTGALDWLNNRNYREAVNYINKNTVYDYDLLAELYSDPNKLMQTDLRKLRGKVPAVEINRLARRQVMLRTEQGRNALEKLTFDMKTVLFQNGINLNSTKKNDIETRALLNDYMTRSLESFRADHKRYPTDKERLEMLQTAVGDVVIPRMFWFPKTVKRFEATPQQYIDSLSTPERMQLVEVANAAGITGTEDEKILAVLRSKGEL